MGKPIVLVFLGYYLPGYKAGGPIRAIENLTAHLAEDLEFRIVTSDRDLGDAGPHAGVEPNRWLPLAQSTQVMYLPSSEQSWHRFGTLLSSVPHNLVYLNSVFSRRFSILPLVMRRAGLFRAPTVIAPRGEFAASALRQKALRKRALLSVARTAELFVDLIWQAADQNEAADIEAVAGRTARIAIAPDLIARASTAFSNHTGKQPGYLSVAFLSRISRVKNLDGALRLLARTRHNIRFDIYGPIEDAGYWRECQTLLSALPANITVRQLGPIPHHLVQSTLASYDLFFLPSHGESFGYAIADALAAGCPVLTSDMTPWKDLASHGAGWAIPLQQETGFVAALESVAAMGEGEHGDMRRKAAAYVRRSAADSVIQQSRDLFMHASRHNEDAALAGSGP